MDIEQCVVCEAWFKRGRGLSKSHKSSAEIIPELHHSGVHSQVFLRKAAQSTGDAKELARQEEGKPVEQKEEVEDREVKREGEMEVFTLYGREMMRELQV
jgi:hypothetical protein